MTTSQVERYSKFHGLEKFMDMKYVCAKRTHTVDTQNNRNTSTKEMQNLITEDTKNTHALLTGNPRVDFVGNWT